MDDLQKRCAYFARGTADHARYFPLRYCWPLEGTHRGQRRHPQLRDVCIGQVLKSASTYLDFVSER